MFLCYSPRKSHKPFVVVWHGQMVLVVVVVVAAGMYQDCRHWRPYSCSADAGAVAVDADFELGLFPRR